MSFMHTLKVEERDILRKVVRNVHMQYYPKHFQTDYEADKIIASIAPETVAALIKAGKDKKVDQL
jgi:hypothetical protein|tara:strand:+ start:234 stop:428 length:195 start_codon:yes stop_codon:yes gene_type:complete